MTYNFEFSVWKTNCDKFKQKQVDVLKNTISGSRLREDMKFSGYALITFDESDECHRHPIITDMDDFNRLKTNCLVYDLYETDANKGYYDKLFIYQTNGTKTNGFYGYLLYDSNSGKTHHKYYIDRLDDELCRQLSKSFNIMRFRERYHPYE